MTESTALDRTLAALADPTRRRVVELLGERPRAAGELARATDVAAPLMSRHLRHLKTSGLVADSHPAFDARVRIYCLTPAPIAELADWLARAEQMWADQLAGFKAHIEANSSGAASDEETP